MTTNRSLENYTRRSIRRNFQLNHHNKYVIVTDGDRTEYNYLNELFQFVSDEGHLNLEWEIHLKIKTEKILEECSKAKNEILFRDFKSVHIWIVFDRDEVPNFDNIISEAKRNRYHVAWSNPCIEEWFWAYFDSLKSHTSSVETNNLFKDLFKKCTGKSYSKNLPGLYRILLINGDEDKAISRAEEKIRMFENNQIVKYSLMQSATTVYELVKELKLYIKDKK